MKRGVVKGDIEATNASQLCEKERVRILDKKFCRDDDVVMRRSKNKFFNYSKVSAENKADRKGNVRNFVVRKVVR